MIINGDKNKTNIVNHLNNHKVKELYPHFKSMVKELYPACKDDDYIKCELSNKKKINLSIYINKIKKNISIKYGTTSTLFNGLFINLYDFLLRNNIDVIDLIYLKKYHYNNIVSNNVIDKFNEIFSRNDLLSKLISFLLIEDVNEQVDYVYYGNLKSGIGTDVLKLKDSLLDYSNHYEHNFLRFGPFNFQSPYKKDKIKRDFCLIKISNLYKYIRKCKG